MKLKIFSSFLFIVMDLTENNEINETASTIEKEAIFITEDLGNDKTFESILDKFNNYRFTEHIDFLRNDHECQSYSSILFTINFTTNGNERKFSLFTAILEIPDRTEIEYTTSTMYEDVEERETIVNGLLKYKLYDKVIVRAEMEIKFYKNRSLDILDQYQDEEFDEGYSDDESPPAIIESSFISNKCSVCLSMKPDILNIPCLHLAICYKCEEIGKLLRCVVCRKKIERKIKI